MKMSPHTKCPLGDFYDKVHYIFFHNSEVTPKVLQISPMFYKVVHPLYLSLSLANHSSKCMPHFIPIKYSSYDHSSTSFTHSTLQPSAHLSIHIHPSIHPHIHAFITSFHPSCSCYWNKTMPSHLKRAKCHPEG